MVLSRDDNGSVSIFGISLSSATFITLVVVFVSIVAAFISMKSDLDWIRKRQEDIAERTTKIEAFVSSSSQDRALLHLTIEQLQLVQKADENRHLDISRELSRLNAQALENKFRIEQLTSQKSSR